MFILNDEGDSLNNTDQVFTFAKGDHPQLGRVLIAISPTGTTQTVLCAGSDERCDKALVAILDGIKQRRLFLDLRDVLGQRSELTIARSAVALPNGHKIP